MTEGLQMGWVDAAKMPEEVYTCTAFDSGSISEQTPRSLEEIHELVRRLNLLVRNGYRAPQAAVKELEQYAGVQIGGIVPGVLGAANTSALLDTTARLGIPLVDGDYSGQSVLQDMQPPLFSARRSNLSGGNCRLVGEYSAP